MNKLSYKKRIAILSIVTSLFVSLPACAIGEKPSDFTGDSFFTSPIMDSNENFIPLDDNNNDAEQKKLDNPNRTIPPIKMLRLKAKAFYFKRKDLKEQKMNPQPIQVVEDNQEEQYNLDSDNIKAKEKRKKQAETAEQTQITIDCKHMDYLTETGLMTATGNVLVSFPHQQTTLEADNLNFDKNTNKMHGWGNVVITRGGQKTYGESIDIDLNEESIFIAKPVTQNTEIKIVAQEGYVQKNIITQVNGTIDVEHSSPINLRTSGGPDARQYMRTMIIPEEEQRRITDGKSKIFKIQAEEIIINSKENLDTLRLKKARITSGGKTVLKIPRMKIYSNKGHDFVEGNYPELGSRRYLGMYIGPGFIVELPRGALLKLIPALTYKGKIGVGGVARLWTPTNQTQVSYGTSKSRIVVRGEQKLDDNLTLKYASFDYTDDWFLGRRMPKYGADLIYKKSYTTSSIFGASKPTTYEHRISAGYFQDMYEDKYYEQLSSTGIGTTRFRYMARLSQPLYDYRNLEKQLYTSFSVNFEGAATLYGTGNTQTIGRIGPNWHIQYKRWMQDLGYMLSAYSDDTPMPVFDAYRYGHSNVYLREYLRVCPYLTLAWQGSVTLTNDTYNDKLFQECSFYASVGPQDLKLNFGYDFVRENAFINFVLAVDPKGTTVDYGKMVIKNPENFNKQRKKNEELYRAAHQYTQQEQQESGVLTKAVVEDIKENLDDI